MEKVGKLIIFAAPSGSGKSTMVKKLKETGLDFGFSISATSRALVGMNRMVLNIIFSHLKSFVLR